MDQRWLNEIMAYMRQVGSDTQEYEVKEAKGGLPKTLGETLSAFSNGSGGFVILGVSERAGFVPVDGFDVGRMQDALCCECEKLTPIVRPDIEIIPFEGSQVLCARIRELHPRDKPCYITSRGKYDGSFIRTGDGDRRLSGYEIDRLLEEHKQPTYDDELVAGASMEDMAPELVDGFIKRQKELHPRILGTRGDNEVLVDLHVAKWDGDVLRPTLAGLMAMGLFPQKFFPRLNVTFTAFPGATKAERASDGRRFLDTQTIIGPIPVMIEDVLSAVQRNTRTGAVIEGAFRKDVPDYPLTAVREAVANALMHRDYSPEGRGSQVQVNLYVDRLEILNPGGLYGDVTIESLGKSGISSSRNQFLSNILETTPFGDGGYVVENRGTGYQEIEEQLKQSFMMPPRPKNSTVAFSLTLDKRRVMKSEAATKAKENIDTAIINHLKKHSSASTKELMAESGLGRSAIANHVRKLIDEGTVEPVEPGRSPKQRYRLVH